MTAEARPLAGSLELAASPAATDEQLRELARDDSLEVRQGVASNPSTPAEVLMELAFDPSARVRGTLGIE